MALTQVQTGMLADLAVTNAKMAAGAARANFGAGAVLQVVSAIYSSRQIFTGVSSLSYQDTGLAATITPSSATSKILILVSACHQSDYRTTVNVGSALGLKRGSTRIAGAIGDHVGTITNAENIAPTGSIVLLDSPSTTSPTTYTTLITAVGGSSTTLNFNGTYSQTGFDATITLLEIAA